MIPDAVLNQIQDRVDIVEVVSGYVALKRAGRSFKANCPFHHEKTPSFIVNPDKQIFHCFGCGAGGNVFSFLMKEEKKDFLEVVEMLAERVGVEIPKAKGFSPQAAEKHAELVKANELAANFYHDFLLHGKEAEAARAYLKKRGISEGTVAHFKLGYAPESWDGLCRALKGKAPEAVLEKAGLVIARKEGGFYDRFRHRVMFPILDTKGACVAFGGRVLDDSVPKYLNSPETELYSKGRNLYGLFQGKKDVREKDSVIVVEGYMDVVTCHQAGVGNAVASLGTALTPDQVRLVKRNTKNVFILYDADPAGELATLRGLELFLEEDIEVKIVRLPQGHDPDSYIKEHGRERFQAAFGDAQTLFDYKLALLKTKHDPRSVEGRVRIANEMVDLLSRVRNEILKAAWLKELARGLDLSEEALLAELRRSGAKARPAPDAQPSSRLQDELRAVEKMLIGLMLDEPQFIARGREILRADDFQHHKARHIARRLLEAEHATLAARELINFYKEDPEAVRIIALACAELESILDKDKTFEDCLQWMRRSRLSIERDSLRSQLAAAQSAGDKNRIHQLLYDFNELNKGMRKINEKA
ncbi:MAG: DNA primase [Candidatus Omnitrophota bacterium]